MRRQLLALAILLTIADHAAAQTNVVLPAPGRKIVLPSASAIHLPPETTGRFTVLTPGRRPFVVLPESYRGFEIVPLSDRPEDSGLSCCRPR
jgi:hypothetical protein